jgi:hypothetical protein
MYGIVNIVIKLGEAKEITQDATATNVKKEN